MSTARSDALAMRRRDEVVVECGGCYHYQPDAHDDGFGRCRRRAPVVVVADGGAEARWPIVDAGDRCGEFERPFRPAA